MVTMGVFPFQGKTHMYELKKIGKVFTSKFVRTGLSSYKKKKICRAAVSQRLRNTDVKYLLFLSDFNEN